MINKKLVKKADEGLGSDPNAR
jgi:hypothetical protein